MIYAKRIAAGRALRSQTQLQLAQELTKVTGEIWTRDDISSMERGKKAFEVPLLTAIAEAQNLPIDWYVYGEGALGDPRSIRPEGPSRESLSTGRHSRTAIPAILPARPLAAQAA